MTKVAPDASSPQTALAPQGACVDVVRSGKEWYGEVRRGKERKGGLFGKAA
jgi:hypothetical protein